VVFRDIQELDVLIVRIINLFGLIKVLAVGDSIKFTKCTQHRWAERFGRALRYLEAGLILISQMKQGPETPLGARLFRLRRVYHVLDYKMTNACIKYVLSCSDIRYVLVTTSVISLWIHQQGASKGEIKNQQGLPTSGSPGNRCSVFYSPNLNHPIPP
jgi:hypothetical protein